MWRSRLFIFLSLSLLLSVPICVRAAIEAFDVDLNISHNSSRIFELLSKFKLSKYISLKRFERFSLNNNSLLCLDFWIWYNSQSCTSVQVTRYLLHSWFCRVRDVFGSTRQGFQFKLIRQSQITARVYIRLASLFANLVPGSKFS